MMPTSAQRFAVEMNTRRVVRSMLGDKEGSVWLTSKGLSVVAIVNRYAAGSVGERDRFGRRSELQTIRA